MPGGLPGGGMLNFRIDRRISPSSVVLIPDFVLTDIKFKFHLQKYEQHQKKKLF